MLFLSFTSSVQYSQTAPADALSPLCLKGLLIFVLSGQSALPQKRLFMYGCRPDRFTNNKATAVLKGIFCRSKWHWLILSLTGVFIEMGCIYPSERQGLCHFLNTKPIWMPWCLHHLPFQILSIHRVTAMFTFNYRCPFMNQATSRFKRQGWFMSAYEKQPRIIPFLFVFVRDI